MEQGPLTRSERITYAVVLVLILGGFVAEIVRDFEPVKLSALFFVLAGPVMLTVHEFGHAIIARLVGWKVDRIVLGFGRTWWRFEVRGIDVHVRTVPIEGFTRTRNAGPRKWRAKSAAVYAAGCGLELVVAGLLIVVIGPGDFFSKTQHIPTIAGQSVVAFVALSCFSNLIPHSCRETVITEEGVEYEYTPNDGLGIVRSLFGPVGG